MLSISNSDKITVEIPQTVFATINMLQRLQEQVNSLALWRNGYIHSIVGREKYFNTDNSYKDADIIKLGYKTYGLAGAIVNIADYETAFKNCNALDLGDGTFKIPEMFDGTIRHIPRNSTRELGTYETDDFKAHGHDMTHTHSMAHDHDMSHQHFYSRYENARGGFYNGSYWTPTYTDQQTWGGRDRTGGSSAGNTGGSSITTTGNTGSIETRMKNTSGQWYLLLSIDI
ncbi:MAG: hypothetical protein LBQ34_01325 [Alphaproteobacteria bacterium]|nr:hypothetical protein [Alphaproteobacteria bacterium]